MKRVFIIHYWDGYPNYCWYPWVKKELEKNGFQVVVLTMPETEMPRMDKWVPELRRLVGSPDKDTYFIGHSAGCITILRYLEFLKENEKIKSHCENFVAIHSDNDPYVPLKQGDILKEELNAKLIVKHNMDHFLGKIGDKDSCIELSDVVEEIIKMEK